MKIPRREDFQEPTQTQEDLVVESILNAVALAIEHNGNKPLPIEVSCFPHRLGNKVGHLVNSHLSELGWKVWFKNAWSAMGVKHTVIYLE